MTGSDAETLGQALAAEILDRRGGRSVLEQARPRHTSANAGGSPEPLVAQP